jgi:hypothetical protein
LTTALRVLSQASAAGARRWSGGGLDSGGWLHCACRTSSGGLDCRARSRTASVERRPRNDVVSVRLGVVGVEIRGD